MTREKIAGFLFAIGVGMALGFFLRTDEEEKHKQDAPVARDAFGRKTPDKSSGRFEAGHPPPPPSNDVEVHRTTSFAM